MVDFTAKELLLATKDKISEIEKKLQILSDLTCIKNDKNIESVRYVLLHGSTDFPTKRPRLSCVFEWNDRRIKGMINNSLVRMNRYRWGSESGLVIRDDNGKNYIANKDYAAFIPRENQEEFSSITDELLTDEFVLNFLSQGVFYSRESSKLKKVDLYPSPISIEEKEIGVGKRISFLYYPVDNKACFMIQNGNELTDEMLQELLNSQLDPAYYSDYVRRTIESSDQTTKDIFIPKFKDKSGKLDFNVQEDYKRLSLVRR